MRPAPSFREIDPVQLAPRVAAAVYLAAGLLALAIERLLPDLHAQHSLVEIAAVALVGGAVALVAPWQRFEPRAQLVLAAFAFLLFAWGGVLANGALSPYLAMLPLPFVFIGFTQRPGTAILVAPAAAFALVIGGRFNFDPVLVLTLVFALPMSAIVGESLAFAQLRRTRRRTARRTSAGGGAHPGAGERHPHRRAARGRPRGRAARRRSRQSCCSPTASGRAAT